jgi:cytochrome c oxidase assembly factor CtaG/cytochrome c2
LTLAVSIVALCAASTARAHSAAAISAGDDAVSESFLVALVAASLAYATGTRRLWQRAGLGHAVRPSAAVAFASAVALIAIEALSPLHELGRRGFAAHMFEHEMLMVAVAPLLVIARPSIAIAASLPASLRAAYQRARKSVWLRPLTTLRDSAVAATGVHGAVLWVWHVPALFDAAVRNEALHLLQHATFVGSAILFWAALLRPRSASARGGAVLWMFATALHGSVLGALLTFATRVLYAPYQGGARPLGLSALEDQALGGLVMWIVGGLVYAVGGLALAASLLRRSRAGVVVVVAGAALAIASGGCRSSAASTADAAAIARGNPQAGRALVRAVGCQSCHHIAGFHGPEGNVGPPLDSFPARMTIAGKLSNTPDDLVYFLMHPQAVVPGGAMLDLHLDERAARDIAAFLLSAR